MTEDPQIQFNLREGETLARLDDLAHPSGDPPRARSRARGTWAAIVLALLLGSAWLLGWITLRDLAIALAVMGAVCVGVYLRRRAT
ncbi:MAG: hypothetical protein QOG85_870 [Gaiellaceae bacterium]|nr:hypothetical protein [Gaiellaceae bacterium]